MEEPFPSQKKDTWQKKLLWIGLGIFVLVLLSIVVLSVSLGEGGATAPTSCTFTHKTSLVNSMTDQESKILTVSLYGEGESSDCTTDVRLDITNFDISPPENIQKASIVAHQTTQVIWVLSPKNQGKFSYVVSFPDSQALTPDESTVKVTNGVGFPAWVTSVLAPAAATVLGPLLTVPYWIDKYSSWTKKRKGKQRTQVGRIRRRSKKR